MKDHRHWRRLVALLMVGGLLLAACSSGSDGDSSPNITGSSSDTSEATDVDPNGILNIGYDISQSGVDWDFNALRFVTGSANSNDSLWSLPYARLMKPTLEGKNEPDLATSVDIVDKNTINITLREGLKFSDGSPLDANAVKASYEAVLAAEPNNTNGYLPPFYKLKTITVNSPTTLTLGFPDGTAASWSDQYVSTWAGSIFKFGGPDPLNPIGAGPFKITGYTPGQSYTMEKNPNYWNAENVKIAGVKIQQVVFAQPQSGLAAVQSGQVDVTFSEPNLISSMTGNIKPVVKVSPNSAAMMHFCKASGPLADAKVRQAINKALDREAISEAVYSGTAEPQTEPWPEGHRLWNPEAAETLAYDPEGAKQLLADAGYPNGFDVNMYPIQAFGLVDTAAVVQQQLKAVGINVTIVPTTDYVGQYLSPNTAGIGLYPSNTPGPQKLVSWTGDSMGNVCDYKNPEIDRLAQALGGTSEQSEEAVDLWHQVDTLVTDEALSGFIVFTSAIGAYNADRIGNMEPWPIGNYIIPDVSKSYIKQ
jgi:peptide/nickel transport system substrate-binding protein